MRCAPFQNLYLAMRLMQSQSKTVDSMTALAKASDALWQVVADTASNNPLRGSAAIYRPRRTCILSGIQIPTTSRCRRRLK
jgi:hypothetical protein